MYYINHPANDLQLMDQRLIEIYGEAQCLKWKNESPSFLNYHAFEIVNGHYIDDMDLHIHHRDEFENLESYDPVNFPVDEILEQNSSFINPNRFNVKRSFLQRKYYRLGNSNKILILLSGEELKRMYEK